jgi:hypothetical protein
MNKLAAKALESYEDDEGGDKNPFAGKSDDGGSEDLETEMEEFLEAAGKKDVAAMAAAFRSACRLCR